MSYMAFQKVLRKMEADAEVAVGAQMRHRLLAQREQTQIVATSHVSTLPVSLHSMMTMMIMITTAMTTMMMLVFVVLGTNCHHDS